MLKKTCIKVGNGHKEKNYQSIHLKIILVGNLLCATHSARYEDKKQRDIPPINKPHIV